MPDLIHHALRQFIVTALATLMALLPSLAVAELSITNGSAALASQPVETAPEWVYTLRPGDTLASISASLLQKSANGQRLLAHNGLAANTRLESGDTLRIPVFWLKRQPEPARVTSVSGNVQHISGSDGRKTPLTGQSLVRVGDEVLSGAGSATLELADGSELRIAPNTRLMFNRLTQYGKAGMVDTRLRLQKGEVHTRVKPLIEGGSRFEIETPSAVAAVRGTVFSMQTNASGSSIQVKHGAVDFGRPGQTRRVPAGYGASVEITGTRGMSIRQLPPAPAINAIGPVLDRLPAELSWQPGPTPMHRVDIFEKESGDWVQSREVTGNRFTIGQLDNGEYEIQLAALDHKGIAGMPATASVEVDLQAIEPVLQVPAPGESVNDDMPEFRWQLNGTNELARVEIAEDDSFQRLSPGKQSPAVPPAEPGQVFLAGSDRSWRQFRRHVRTPGADCQRHPATGQNHQCELSGQPGASVLGKGRYRQRVPPSAFRGTRIPQHHQGGRRSGYHSGLAPDSRKKVFCARQSALRRPTRQPMGPRAGTVSRIDRCKPNDDCKAHD